MWSKIGDLGLIPHSPRIAGYPGPSHPLNPPLFALETKDLPAAPRGGDPARGGGSRACHLLGEMDQRIRGDTPSRRDRSVQQVTGQDHRGLLRHVADRPQDDHRHRRRGAARRRRALGAELSTFADAEALTPLDGFIQGDGMTNEQWLARYYPIYASICSHAGHVYAGISTPASMALYWNKTLFREAGLDPDRPPATLAEFDAYCRRLTRRDPRTGGLVQVGFLPQEPGWWPWVFCDWFGGSLFDGHSVTFATNPKNIAAMRWVRSFTTDNGLDDVKTFSSYFGAVRFAHRPVFHRKDRHGLPGSLVRRLHRPVQAGPRLRRWARGPRPSPASRTSRWRRPTS